MLICAFPPHYQLVYISFDISSFSLISYIVLQLNSAENVSSHIYTGPGYMAITSNIMLQITLFS